MYVYVYVYVCYVCGVGVSVRSDLSKVHLGCSQSAILKEKENSSQTGGLNLVIAHLRVKHSLQL